MSEDRMDCAAAAERITALVDGQLPEGERAALEAHLASCPACREAREGEEAVAARLRALPRSPVPAGFREGVMGKVRLEAAASPGGGGGRILPMWPIFVAVSAVAAAVVAMIVVGHGESRVAYEVASGDAPAAAPVPVPSSPARAREALDRKGPAAAAGPREEKAAGAGSDAEEREDLAGRKGRSGLLEAESVPDGKDLEAARKRAPGADPAGGPPPEESAPGREPAAPPDDGGGGAPKPPGASRPPPAPGSGEREGEPAPPPGGEGEKGPRVPGDAREPRDPDAPADKKEGREADRAPGPSLPRVALYFQVESVETAIAEVERVLMGHRGIALERRWKDLHEITRYREVLARADLPPELRKRIAAVASGGPSGAGGGGGGAEAPEKAKALADEILRTLRGEKVLEVRMKATDFRTLREALARSDRLREGHYVLVTDPVRTTADELAWSPEGEGAGEVAEEAGFASGRDGAAQTGARTRAAGEPVPPPSPTEEQLRRFAAGPPPRQDEGDATVGTGKGEILVEVHLVPAPPRAVPEPK